MDNYISHANFQSRAAARLYTNNRVRTPGAGHKPSGGPIAPAYVVSLSSAVQVHMSTMAQTARS
jgi:hypothetical protein